jgi:hypothetical protein
VTLSHLYIDIAAPPFEVLELVHLGSSLLNLLLQYFFARFDQSLSSGEANGIDFDSN